MASDRVRWWLDLFAMLVGVFALYMLVSDTLIRVTGIDRSSRACWYGVELTAADDSQDSPGYWSLFLYLIQLLMNLSRHFQSRMIEFGVLLLTALILFGRYACCKSAIIIWAATACSV